MMSLDEDEDDDDDDSEDETYTPVEGTKFGWKLAVPPTLIWFQPNGHLHWAIGTCVTVYRPLPQICVLPANRHLYPLH